MNGDSNNKNNKVLWYCAPIHAKKLEIASHSYGYYQIMSDCANTIQCRKRQVSFLVVNIVNMLAYPMGSNPSLGDGDFKQNVKPI